MLLKILGWLNVCQRRYYSTAVFWCYYVECFARHYKKYNVSVNMAINVFKQTFKQFFIKAAPWDDINFRF